MEACLSAHFASRVLRALGHEPRIIPAIYVKPFLKGQKNDYNDAEAIAEAALRPNLRVVKEKSQDQLDLQARRGFGVAGSSTPAGQISANVEGVGKRDPGAVPEPASRHDPVYQLRSTLNSERRPNRPSRKSPPHPPSA
jgi:transposase